MKSFRILLCLLAVYGITILPAGANHIFGGDFSYTFLSGNSYRVTLVLYADCAAAYTTSAYSELPTAHPTVELRENNVLKQTLTLSIDSGSIDITPVCDSERAFTTCHGANYTIPGVTKFVYSATVTLNTDAALWDFRFTGNLGSNSSAGRSTSVTNIVNGTNSLTGVTTMVLEATLNTAAVANNSSPQFTGLATPFYCINVPQQYNLGAVDPNHDSLSFALVNALDLNAAPVSYTNGTNATHPLQTAGNISFSNINGQLAFTPNEIQRSIIDVRETEYRNGVVIGTAMREMTFVVLGTCNNAPPAGYIDSSTVTGGQLAATNIVNACAGSTVTFHILPRDSVSGVVNTTLTGITDSAAVTLTANNSDSTDISFSLNTALVPTGTYTFYATYSNKGCPLSATQTQAYTVRVADPPEIADTVLLATQCAHKSLIQFNTRYGLLPRTITIFRNDTVIQIYTDSTGVVADSFSTGTYTAVVSSAYLSCTNQITFSVADSGAYPAAPITATPVQYCKDAAATVLSATAAPGGVLYWYNAAGALLPAAPLPGTTAAGNTIYYVNQSVSVCRPSPYDTILVQVTPQPTADFTATPDDVCARRNVLLQYTGYIADSALGIFNWQTADADSVFGSGYGPLDVQWSVPGVKTVTLQVTENGCSSVVVQHPVFINPRPVAAFTVSDVCQYAPLVIAYSSVPLENEQDAWTFNNADLPTGMGEGPFTVYYNSVGTDTITLVSSLGACSDTLSQAIHVRPHPEVVIPIKADTACFGDIVYLKATGADSYQWLPASAVNVNPTDSLLFVRVDEPTVYTVVGSTVYGCTDTASIAYNNVIACCTFSYPDAFTPNGDGKNDGYRPVIYGNQLYYNFSIYNRWGQCVFHSQDPSQKWDGTVNGRPCDVDTYYYHMKAKCLTGKTEEHEGDFILVR